MQLCPERDAVAIRQSDGNQHLGAGQTVPNTKTCGSCAIRFKTRSKNWPMIWTCPRTGLPIQGCGRESRRILLAPWNTNGRDLYPMRCSQGYASGRFPKPPPLLMPRCPNKVRYEVMDHLGYFCTESSEHFAEYVPWFIKDGRQDLIAQFSIPLDEYPTRAVWNRSPILERTGQDADRWPQYRPLSAVTNLPLT